MYNPAKSSHSPICLSKRLALMFILFQFFSSEIALAGTPISSYGALCDGVTDDSAAFTQAANDLSNGTISVLEIRGTCNLSSPWLLTGISHYQSKVIDAWGAVLNNTVIVKASGLSIKGLSVVGSPSDGFVFLRGQGASHERLSARNNAGHGFYFGTRNGVYGANSQVTNTVFLLPSAIANAEDGYHWDGDASANRGWFNANTLIQPVSRNNTGSAWQHTTGAGPNGTSRTNYNTIISPQFEQNGAIASFRGSRAFTFLGGHMVDKNTAGDSVEFGDISYILGGRYVGDIINKNSENVILVNSSAPGEGARIHYLRHLDTIQ